MKYTMTFHESYGELPKSTLMLVKRYNVSPADFDHILNYLLILTWGEVNAHIITHSETGMYRPRYF